MKNIKNLGQVFTTNEVVKKMIELKKNKGSILEPSCGDGAFFNEIKNCIGIEYDSKVCPINALNMDFFDYSLCNKFDTIIGNPPYVKYKSIGEDTKSKLNMVIFDERSNLYLFFIEKCIEHLNSHGELIFIVPRDFIKASSSIKLNKFIYEQGTITYWEELGDKIIFPGFSPNCVIFRFEKNNFSRKCIKNGKEVQFKEMNGQLIFIEDEYTINFSDIFFVKVGAVSGSDQSFNHPNGNKDFVYSKTGDTQKTKKMFYNLECTELLPFKDLLLNRKIKKFNENNWYTWGRKYYESEKSRIYVNNKTRKLNPFFIHSCTAYDGSILAIFPKKEVSEEVLLEMKKELNNVNWLELGFQCDGRFLFSQKSLEQSCLPEVFSKFLI